MKSLARSYYCWPNIDKDIENITFNCRGCTLVSKEPSKIAIHSWETPNVPWERLHTDYTGPLLGKYFAL